MNSPIDQSDSLPQSPSGRQFVVLFHEFPPEHRRTNHWDLMLETESGLQTWALDSIPKRGATIVTFALADHRKAYLEYEGPVSGERGSVTRVMDGTYCWDQDSDSKQLVLQLVDGELRLVFQGDSNGITIVVS